MDFQKKLYEHDCSRCMFLFSNENLDYYFCHSSTETTLLIRHSSDPSDNRTVPFIYRDRVINFGAQINSPFIAL